MKKVIQSTMMACLALICMCLASCNDEAIVDMSQSDEIGQPFRLTATQETPSRLALGQDGMTVKWDPGDQLVLVKKDRSIVPIYMNVELEEPSVSATFVSETGVPAGDYYVFYNYNDDWAYGHHGFSTIDDINNRDKLVLWGELTVTSGMSSADLQLKHLYAKVRVELENAPSQCHYKIGMYTSKSGFPIYQQFTQNGIVAVDYGRDWENSTWEERDYYFLTDRRFHNIRLGNYNISSWPTGEGGNGEHSNKTEVEKNSALLLPADVSDGTVYFYILDGMDCYEFPKYNIRFEAGKSYKVVLDMTNATKTTLETSEMVFPGDSYSSTVYQLTSPEDCRHAAYIGNEFRYYQLAEDIDFLNDTYLPILARGIDGNGKTMKNISIDWPKEDYVGMFIYDYYKAEEGGVIGNASIDPLYMGCVISNLNIENITINGDDFVGALGGTNIHIKDCKIKGTSYIKGTGDYVGGFVGCNNLYYQSADRGYATISKASIEGDCRVEGKNSVGGIVGEYMIPDSYYLYLYSSLRLIKSCYSSATISATGDYVGGIFGVIGKKTSNIEFASEDYTFSLYECVNAGNVTGGNYVGGIGGAFKLGSSAKRGQVVLSHSANERDISGTSNVGGILGIFQNDIDLCYSIGNISATSTNVGGIAGNGDHPSAKIYNCYSMANLSVGQNECAGGIVGFGGGGAGGCSVKNSYFAGTNPTGYGIIGHSDGYCRAMNCLTTLSYLIGNLNNGWGPDDITGSLTGVTSIFQNKAVINEESAYSDDLWPNPPYAYECVKFATGLSGGGNAPGFSSEIQY